MAVAFVASTSFNRTTLASSQTTSVTVSAGSNIVMVNTTGIETASRTIASIVYNTSENFVQKSAHNATSLTGRIELWYLINPTVTTANCVLSITGGSTARFTGAYTRVTGAHQTTPLGTAGTSDGSGNRSVTITDGATGDLVIDELMDQAGDAAVGAGQTLRWGPLTNSVNVYNGSTEAGGSSVVMSWTLSAFPAFQVAVNIFQASAGGATVTYPELERMTRGVCRGAYC